MKENEKMMLEGVNHSVMLSIHHLEQYFVGLGWFPLD